MVRFQLRWVLAALVVVAVAAVPGVAAPRRALTGTQPPAHGTDYQWPLPGPPSVVTRGFDPPARPWLPGHRGADLAGSPELVVSAAGPGMVLFAGPVAGRGVVSLRHPDGLRTTYQPVTPTVATGDRVRAGDPVGVLVAGHPGCRAPEGGPGRACLHWGLRQGESYLDPLSLLGRGRVRLLPYPPESAA